MSWRAFVLVSVLIAPASMQGQQLDLASGSWVRLRAATLRQLHEAQVVGTSTDSMRFALDIGGPPLPLAIQDISFLEVRRERPLAKRHTFTAMTVGGVLGAGGGTAVALMLAAGCQTTPPAPPGGGGGTGGCGSAKLGQGALIGAAVGAASGGVIALFVSSIATRGRWEVLINR